MSKTDLINKQAFHECGGINNNIIDEHRIPIL